MNPVVHVNGKWLSQNLTGVQRYAIEIFRRAAFDSNFDWVLHIPKGAKVPTWIIESSVVVKEAPVTGVVFEQIYLPVATAGKLLINFAGPAPLLKSRQFVTMHDATPFRFRRTFRRSFVAFYFVMYFILARTARGVATVSDFSAAELSRYLSVPKSRFHVVPCGSNHVDAMVPSDPRIEGAGPDSYLVVGTLAVHKNLESTVAAMTREGKSVVVVGAAGMGHVFARSGSLPGEAIVAGRLSDSELVWLYRNCRALVFPSKYEGFGIPVVEAQRLGCVVISSDAASLPEVAGEGALYFDPADGQTLLNKIAFLEADSEIDATLREAGYSNAQRFTWERSAMNVLQWLKSQG